MLDGVDPKRVVEIYLVPEKLIGDTCEVCVRALAKAVQTVFPRGLPQNPRRIWTRRASELLLENKLPLPPQFPTAVQVKELTRLLGSKDFCIEVVARQFPRALEQVVEWLKSHAVIEVRKIVLRPSGSRQVVELITDVAVMNRSVEQGCRVSVFQKGKPHAHSPGEKKLFQRLEADPELAGLFKPNAEVLTRHGRRFCVDFLQAKLRFVVEVDGYTYHHSRTAFFSDRHRDYELLVSGFTTLRLDHDEILRDIESALEKVRDVFHFLRGSIG
ncbi:MAG: DUF559 domain-containing protein [Verrucomicrobiia bacterium]